MAEYRGAIRGLRHRGDHLGQRGMNAILVVARQGLLVRCELGHGGKRGWLVLALPVHEC